MSNTPWIIAGDLAIKPKSPPVVKFYNDQLEIDAVAMDDGVQISVNRHKRIIAESELKTNNLTKDELIAIVRKIANKEAQSLKAGVSWATYTKAYRFDFVITYDQLLKSHRVPWITSYGVTIYCDDVHYLDYDNKLIINSGVVINLINSRRFYLNKTKVSCFTISNRNGKNDDDDIVQEIFDCVDEISHLRLHNCKTLPYNLPKIDVLDISESEDFMMYQK